MMSGALEVQELEALVDGIWKKYRYDFRNYSRASLHRRFKQISCKTGLENSGVLLQKVLDDSEFFSHFLTLLTVPVTEMFRDPEFFKQIRLEVIPMLQTYPSIKIWVAGCSTGEEVYSYAILLHEAGLLKKSLIYGTDINPASLSRAKTAVFENAQIRKYTENYQKSGGTGAFSDYYRTAYGASVIDPIFRKNILFADHSLATDEVFSEVHLVSCRNVLIYFDHVLQNRSLGLFTNALCRRGFLTLGSKETLRFSPFSTQYVDFVKGEKIYRKK